MKFIRILWNVLHICKNAPGFLVRKLIYHASYVNSSYEQFIFYKTNLIVVISIIKTSK